MEGLRLKGDFEQSGSVRGNPGNKAACFERGHADRFMAQCPIWIKKKEKWQKEGETAKGKIKRLVSSVGTQIALWLNVQFGSKRKVAERRKNHEREKEKEKERKVSNVCVSGRRRNRPKK